MARANLLGIVGATFSIISVALVWFSRALDLGFGSGETDLSRTVSTYTSDVSMMFIVGAFVALLTPLGATLQLPALVSFPFVIWYRGLSYYWTFGYAIALIGAAVSIISIFVQITLPGIGLRLPPESRIRVLSLGKDERQSRPIPRSVKLALISIVIAVTLIMAGIAAAAYTRPMSKISVTAYVANGEYKNLTVTVDGKVISSIHISSSYVVIHTAVNVTAGSHKLSAHLTPFTIPPNENMIERILVVRVLPFTTEEVSLSFGVGLV